MGRLSNKYRRYSRAPIKEIAKELHISKEEALRSIGEILQSGLMRQCYDDKGNVIADLYELPVSLKDIEDFRTRGMKGGD